MTDLQTSTTAGSQTPLTVAEAADKLASRRTESGTDDLSMAARTLSQKAAEARLARRVTAAGEAMGAGDEDAPEEASADGAMAQDMPDMGNEPAEGEDGLIDLGDGTRVSLQQIREGFMLKADHTRKTQMLAEERRSLEGLRAQKLSALDQLLANLQSQMPAPKKLQTFLAEDPVNGLAKFAQQVDRLQQLSAAREFARAQQDEHFAAARADRDRELAENYWTSREEAGAGTAAAAKYAQSYGYDEGYLAVAMTDPVVVAILDKARRFDDLQAGKARIGRMVADKPRVVKPGAKVTAQAARFSAMQNARSKLRSSGSLQDAVAYLQAQRQSSGG